MINPRMFNELLDKAADPVCIAAGLSPEIEKFMNVDTFRTP